MLLLLVRSFWLLFLFWLLVLCWCVTCPGFVCQPLDEARSKPLNLHHGVICAAPACCVAEPRTAHTIWCLWHLAV